MKVGLSTKKFALNFVFHQMLPQKQISNVVFNEINYRNSIEFMSMKRTELFFVETFDEIQCFSTSVLALISKNPIIKKSFCI